MSISAEERDTQVDLMVSASSAAVSAGYEYAKTSRRVELEEIVSECAKASKAAEKLEDWNG